MTRYALLLRGVNVGGRRPLPMPQWRDALTTLGLAGVQTYLQSGNAVVTTNEKAATLAARVERGLVEHCGVTTGVIVRSADELADVVARNPFPEAAAEKPAWLHVAFLTTKPDAGWLNPLVEDAYLPDEFRVDGREVFMRFAAGAGRSKMATTLLRGLGAGVTARNWNTVVALARLTSGSTD